MREVDIVTCGMMPQPIKHLPLVQLGSTAIVTITDVNGCSNSDTINVTLADPLIVTLDSTSITCNDSLTGWNGYRNGQWWNT